jgi:hypothetical protein
VVAAGAVGALGTAIAIGVSTQASGTTDTTQEGGSGGQPRSWTDDRGESGDLAQEEHEDDDEDEDEDQQFDQSTPDGGQLAVPGDGAPQAHSGGS